jgi:hypothetical protein
VRDFHGLRTKEEEGHPADIELFRHQIQEDKPTNTISR